MMHDFECVQLIESARKTQVENGLLESVEEVAQKSNGRKTFAILSDLILIDVDEAGHSCKTRRISYNEIRPIQNPSKSNVMDCWSADWKAEKQLQ